MKKISAVKGFTLIELLIVIALLGALAIGLLATIDPFEQLKKGRDTATRNTATEFYNGLLRYYGTKGAFPWNDGPGEEDATVDALALDEEVAADYFADLIAAGELKSNFEDAAGAARLGNIFVTSLSNDELVVCFSPESKNFRLDPNTIWTSAGEESDPDNNCGTPDAADEQCFWCIK